MPEISNPEKIEEIKSLSGGVINIDTTMIQQNFLLGQGNSEQESENLEDDGFKIELILLDFYDFIIVLIKILSLIKRLFLFIKKLYFQFKFYIIKIITLLSNKFHFKIELILKL